METDSTISLHGTCDPRFERVREEFARNFAERNELGAAVTISIGNEVVVDLWGGWMDAVKKRSWQEDTIVCVWSVGKAMTALATLHMTDRGRIELDAPVSRYWPEFAQAGKRDLPVRYLLTHQAGLSAVRKELPPGANVKSWETMTRALAEQEPWWEPGSDHGYHTNTYGFLAGEVVRRVDGRSLGTYVREEIAEPFGIDFHIGFGPEHDARTADWLHAPPDPTRRPWLNADPAKIDGLDLMRYQAYKNPPPAETGDGADATNSREWRAAEFPSTNPHSNARALARMFGILANGGSIDGETLLSTEMINRANTIEADGEDILLGRPTRFGLGFQLTIPGIRPLGPNPRSFGHYGNTGILGFADPDAGVGFGYTCNQAGRAWRDPRNIALIDALYECI